MSGQCQGTAARLVCQGLIAAEGFKQSRGEWVTVGTGDTQTLPEQGSLGAVPGQQRHKGFICPFCQAPAAFSRCLPPQAGPPWGLLVPLDTPGSPNPPAPTRSPVHVYKVIISPSDASCLPSPCCRGEGV